MGFRHPAHGFADHERVIETQLARSAGCIFQQVVCPADRVMDRHQIQLTLTANRARSDRSSTNQRNIQALDFGGGQAGDVHDTMKVKTATFALGRQFEDESVREMTKPGLR